MQVQVAGSYFTGNWLVTIGLFFFILELRHPAPTIVLLLQYLL